MHFSHTKVSLFVHLLSLAPSPLDCKLEVCVIPKPFHCTCPAVRMASDWVPVCSVCGSSPCAFTYCQTCKHLLCLSDYHEDWGSSERKSKPMTVVLHLPLDREFAHTCELWVVCALLVSLKAGWSRLVVTVKRISIVLGKRPALLMANLKY